MHVKMKHEEFEELQRERQDEWIETEDAAGLMAIPPAPNIPSVDVPMAADGNDSDSDSDSDVDMPMMADGNDSDDSDDESVPDVGPRVHPDSPRRVLGLIDFNTDSDDSYIDEEVLDDVRQQVAILRDTMNRSPSPPMEEPTDGSPARRRIRPPVRAEWTESFADRWRRARMGSSMRDRAWVQAIVEQGLVNLEEDGEYEDDEQDKDSEDEDCEDQSSSDEGPRDGGDSSADDGTATSREGPMDGTPPTRTFAASSATKKEIAKSQASRADGSKPVVAEKRPCRPKVKNACEEPDFLPDELDLLDPIFEEYGEVLYKEKGELPPRDDVIDFDPDVHQQEFDDCVQWESCPDEYRPLITKIIQDNWDAFTQEGMKKPIRGFQFNIDTGQVKPVCCKPPRHGKHESRIILMLVEKLENNNLIEDDDGPWGALAVLASKPHQEHKHWSEYIWRLCASHRPLNAETRPFTFPSRRCDDSAKDVGSSKFFITMDLLWGHWQVPLTEAAKAKTAFFVPHGKKRWRVMPMGTTNSHPAYNCIIEFLKTRMGQRSGATRFEQSTHDVRTRPGWSWQRKHCGRHDPTCGRRAYSAQVLRACLTHFYQVPCNDFSIEMQVPTEDRGVCRTGHRSRRKQTGGE